MELKKYNYITETMMSWDADAKPYWYEISWESIEEPGLLKSWTGKSRVTGQTKFRDAIEKLSTFPNCARIHLVVYSGQTGKKTLMVETIPVNDRSNGYYPVYPQPEQKKQENNHPAPPPPPVQPQAQNTQMDLIGAVLGAPGLSGVDALHGLLQFRDERLETRYKILELEKEIAQLRLEKSRLEDNVSDRDEQIQELESDIEEMEGQLSILGAENERLQKYVPENSKIGISLTQLGSAVLTNFAKKVVTNQPDKVARILGTDSQTLLGLFDQAPTEPQQIRETQSVNIEAVEEEEISDERKQQLQVIDGITGFLKSLDHNNLAYAQRIVNLWYKDIESIKWMFEYFSGNKNQEESHE